MLMDIRCIALDLDRTTLTREGRLSDGNRAALEYAIGKGCEVVIACGRAFSTLPQEIRAFPGIRYAVTSNGASVCRIPDGRVLMRRCLPPEAAGRILELSDEPGITYEAFVDGVAYADREYMTDPQRFGAGAEAIAYLLATRRSTEDIRAFLLAHAQELDSVDIICWENERMDRLRRRCEMQLQAFTSLPPPPSVWRFPSMRPASTPGLPGCFGSWIFLRSSWPPSAMRIMIPSCFKCPAAGLRLPMPPPCAGMWPMRSPAPMRRMAWPTEYTTF